MHSETTLRQTPRRRVAFTLVELLVVITIIGILAALLVPVVAGALGAGREARIGAEITQIVTAIEETRNSVGAYPPNTQTDGNGSGAVIEDSVIQSDFRRYFNKAFPNHREPDQLIEALVGRSGSNLGATINQGVATNLVGGMTAAESLVFWLGGFSEDPKYPISGANGPSYVDPQPTSRETDVSPSEASRESAIADPIGERNWLLTIEVSRLSPRTGEGDDGFDGKPNAGERYIRYADPRSPDPSNPIVRRINMWRLAAPGTEAAYVYFDASRASTIGTGNDVPAASPLLANIADPLFGALADVYAIKRLKPGNNTTPIFERLEYANDRKFQVLSAGLDSEWGVFPRISPSASDTETDLRMVLVDENDDPLPLVFPTGPWPVELSDTLSNFTGNGGRLEDAQP